MGIYDRDYVRDKPPERAKVGSVNAVSVNTWLIIINTAIFFIASVFMTAPSLRRALVMEPNFDRNLNVPEDLKKLAVADISRFDPRVASPQVAPVYVPMVRDGKVLVGPDKQPIPNPTPVGTALLVNQSVLEHWAYFSTSKGFFGLEVWRFVTFQFLHANIDHLIFNMFGLWFVGALVEEYLGGKRYLAFYLTCGIFGALMYMLLGLLGHIFQTHAFPPLLFDDPNTPLVGASAGIFGVLMAAAFAAPNEIVNVFFIIPMRLRTAVYAFTLLSFGNLIFGPITGGNRGGDAAHIGGAIAGYYFIRHMHLLRDFFDVFGDSRGPKASARAAAATSAPPPSAEVNRILAKISASGMASLTDAEKLTLQRETAAKRT